jgi:hypothetical protein
MSRSYEQIKKEMYKKRGVKHWTKQDVKNILEAQKTGDWSKVHAGNLYNKYGGEYCTLLEVLLA